MRDGVVKICRNQHRNSTSYPGNRWKRKRKAKRHTNIEDEERSSTSGFGVVAAFVEYTFSASAYPVILTFEDHLTPYLQAKAKPRCFLDLTETSLLC
ncbi:hypothetical protein F2Q68_00007875 [Brassica cretica]|uniref:Uncharacterized protein n=1 Tax=Brassica cretica TaxID=69181 RepID=A0A8S9KP96_BRACR|nr:hypothetical protein F2Q68_00007875 [Brassica cretica]